jgi:hypothetical protein
MIVDGVGIEMVGSGVTWVINGVRVTLWDGELKDGDGVGV